MKRQIGIQFCLLLAMSTSVGSYAEQVISPLPEDIAARVANRIVKETTFSFKPSLPRQSDEGYYYLDFYDALGGSDKGLYYARADILVKGLKSDRPDDALFTVDLGISHSAGDLEIKLDGKVIYRKKTRTLVRPQGVDYDRFVPAEYVRLSLPADVQHYKLAIKMVPDIPPEARLWIGFFALNGAPLEGSITLKPPALKSPPNYLHFLVAGPVDARENGLDTQHPLDENTLNFSLDYEGTGGHKIRWDLPRIHLFRKHADRLEYADWRYFTGTVLDSLYGISDTFTHLDYTRYINRHMNFFLKKRGLIAREREEYGRLHSPFGHYFRYALLDDVGMSALPFAKRYMRRYGADSTAHVDDPDYQIALRAAEHIMKNIPRLDDGTIGRINPVALTVWADDMFMGAGILMGMAKVTGSKQYQDEAIKQILLIDKHLVDPVTRVYWHGWFGSSNTHSSSKWARANGWTMMAKTNALLALDKSHKQYATLLKIFQSHAQGLLKLQSGGGRWHQVLDNPGTYLETSSSAMFVRAFAEGIHNGWLSWDEFSEATFKGWKAVTEQITEDGLVKGIVKGTPIFFSDAEYNSHPVRLNDPRGLGAILYMSASMERLRQNQRLR